MLASLRRRVPESAKPLLRAIGHPTRRRVELLAARGHGAVCPCCGGEFRAFRPHNGRPDARCPRCDSFERHRLLWLYLDCTGYLDSGEPLTVLHFAPERALKTRIGRLPAIEYHAADLESPLAEERMDITRIPLPDGSVDLVLCSHVLEHVSDDRQAMRELHRVLRAEGRALMMVPVERGRVETFEDPAATTPEERERLFWQHDHVRIYGSDVADRLREAGFDVTYVDLLAELGEETIHLHRLRKHDRWGPDDIYDCVRPRRA